MSTEHHPESPFARLSRWLAMAGSAWIVVVMLLICADVAGRYLFDRPIAGVAEIVALSIVGIVFLQLTHTLGKERFIRSDVFIVPLLTKRPRAGHLLQAAHHLVGAGVCGFMFAFVLPNFLEAFTEGDYVGIPGVFTAVKWPVYLMVCIGCGLTTVRFLLLAWRDFGVARGANAHGMERGANP